MTLAAVFSPDWQSRAEGAPVLLLLHGYGSNEHDLAGLEPWLPGGLPWASLRAPLEMMHGGAAWFPLDDDDWLRQAPIESATAAIWEWVDANLPDTTPLVNLGFSQGGLMATQLLRTRPERIAATVVLAGFVLAAPQPADAELAGLPGPSKPRVFWGRGTADQVIPHTYVDAAAAWFPGHVDLTERVYPRLAHSINDQEMADVRAFLADANTKS